MAAALQGRPVDAPDDRGRRLARAARAVRGHPLSALSLAAGSGQPLVLRVPRDARAALSVLRHGLAHVHHARALSGLQPPVAVDLVYAVFAVVAARRLVRDSLRLHMAQVKKRTGVASYIAKSPPPARKALKALRAAIKSVAPGITERISYGIPTFDLDGQYLLYIAAFRDHVSVYPVTAGMVARYAKTIAPFRSGKGTLRFSLDSPIPVDLIARLARVRMQERREGGRRRLSA